MPAGYEAVFGGTTGTGTTAVTPCTGQLTISGGPTLTGLCDAGTGTVASTTTIGASGIRPCSTGKYSLAGAISGCLDVPAGYFAVTGGTGGAAPVICVFILTFNS